MDEQLHDIDDLFQNAVQRHSDLPTESVWEHLEKNLQKRNVTSITKQYKKWKWVAAVLFISFVSLSVYTLQLNWKYKKAVRQNHLKSALLNSRKNANTIDNSGPHSNPKAAISSITGEIVKQKNLIDSSKEHILPPDNKIADKIILIDETVILSPGIASIHKSKKKKLTTGLMNISSANDITGEKNKNNKALKMPAAVNTRKAMGKKLDTDPSGNETRAINNSKTGSDSSFTPGIDSRTPAYSSDNLVIKETKDLKASSIREPISSLTREPLVIPFSDLNPSSLINRLIAKNSIRLKTKSLHPQKFTAGIFYSEHIVSTNLEANRPDFREDNYLQIKNHEKNRISTIVGLMISRKISGNLGIATGISLATYITDITRKPLVARKDNNGKINYRISTSSGYAYYTVKTRLQPPLADSIQTLSSKSTIKYISVPIGLQYNFYVGRFGFTPAVLVYANFKSTAKITTIQSSEHTYSGNIEGLKSHYFDWNMGLGIGYYLNKKFSIGLIPSVRFALSNATEKNPVTAQRNSVGLAAGLNFSF
ncbi:MAG: outer membrane beta-barrel protein [Chitinophagaceae bacterium]